MKQKTQKQPRDSKGRFLTTKKQTPIEKRDYSNLKGCEVDYIIMDGETIECFVAGIDYNKGISIVKMDDPDMEWICLNAKNHSHLNYKGCFAHLVRKIKRGKTRCYDSTKVLHSDPFRETVGSISCAFK